MLAFRQQAHDMHDLLVLTNRRVDCLIEWAKEMGRVA